MHSLNPIYPSLSMKIDPVNINHKHLLSYVCRKLSSMVNEGNVSILDPSGPYPIIWWGINRLMGTYTPKIVSIIIHN